MTPDRAAQLLAQPPVRREAQRRRLQPVPPVGGQEQAEVLLHQPSRPVQRVPHRRIGPAGGPDRGRPVGLVAPRRVEWVGRWAANQAWIRSRTSWLAASDAGSGPEHLLGPLGQQLALQGQLRRRIGVEDQPVGQIQGVQPHRQPRRAGLEGQVVEPLGGGRRRGWINRRTVHRRSMDNPGLELRALRRYALSLVCDDPSGSAPHGPDRISTDVCAGQCSPEPWDPAAQLQQALRRVSRAERSREQAPGASWRRARPCKRSTQGTQPVWRTRHSSAKRSA